VRAALYARISQDEHGTQKGVQRQLEDARGLAEARGWDVVGEWLDNDVSAYSGATRAGYDALMAAAEAGEFDRIVVYQTSRLWRSRRERAEAMELLADRRISVAAVSGPELDLSTASGRMIAGVLGEFDTMESAVKGERVARAALQRAQEGRASGPVLYGWRRERILDEHGNPTSFRDVEDPEQSKIVREIVDRLLDGDTLRAISRDFNERGVPAPSGRDGVHWRSGTITKLVARPANIAKRVHHGIKRDKNGRRLPRHSGPCTDDCIIGDAAWPAIVDPERHRAVVALLRDPDRRHNHASPGRKHLLTGGAGCCGVCGEVLRTRKLTWTRQRTGEKVVQPTYICAGPGCTGRAQAHVDQLVGQVVVARLSQPDALDLLHAPAPPSEADQHRRDAEDLRRRLDEAAESYADGLIDRQQLEAITSRLRPAMEKADSMADQVYVAPDLGPLRDMVAAEDVQARWDGLDVRQRRLVVDALGLKVSLMPTKQGPGFKPEDVRIEWGTA
jgi:site-specific DNA recombinase